MTENSNPASRLHEILLSAMQTGQSGHDVMSQWAACFNIDVQNERAIVRRLVQLDTLADEVRSLICFHENINQDLYLNHLDSIQEGLSPLNFDQRWDHVQKFISEAALVRLEFCSELLGESYSEETLQVEDLQEVINTTDALYTAVLQSGLPKLLKYTLFEEVERVRKAISTYDLYGAKGLKEALQGTLGAVITNREELEAAKKKDSAVLQQIGELIDKLDRFTGRAIKLYKIGRHPVKFLIEKLSEPDGSEDA